jgi:hypothetical protein
MELTLTIDGGEIVSSWQQIIEALYRSFHKPTRIALELPAIQGKKGNPMSNYELNNDTFATVTIKTTNSAGVTEPYPPGDVFSVVSSDPAKLGVAIGTDKAGNPAVVITPLVQVAPGVTVTVTDSSGLSQYVQIVDVVMDTTDTNIVLDMAGAVLTPQPVPPS